MFSTELSSALAETHRLIGEVLAEDTGGSATTLLGLTQGACAQALRNGTRPQAHSALVFGRGALVRLSDIDPGLASHLRGTLGAVKDAL